MVTFGRSVDRPAAVTPIILKNGVQFAYGAAATLALANGVIWQETSSNVWYISNATGWQWEATGPTQTADLSQAVTTLTGPLQIDTASGPTISSVVESNSSSVLVAGNTVTLTLNMSEAGDGQHRRRHTDTDVERRRDSDIRRRFRLWSAGLYVHRCGRSEHGGVGGDRGQSKRRGHEGTVQGTPPAFRWVA